jgi:hypothetical protein
MGPIDYPETSVQNYHTTLRNISEARRSHLHRARSVKSRTKHIKSNSLARLPDTVSTLTALLSVNKLVELFR